MDCILSKYDSQSIFSLGCFSLGHSDEFSNQRGPWENMNFTLYQSRALNYSTNHGQSHPEDILFTSPHFLLGRYKLTDLNATWNAPFVLVILFF